jgi:DNA polymerase (family X)
LLSPGVVGDTSSDPVPAENVSLAAKLDEYAALLELAGASYYSWRAFRQAATLIRATPLPVADLVRAGRVRELRGIGRGIETRLTELIETGTLAELDALRLTVSPEIAALARLLGFGAKRGADIAAALGIQTTEELRAAARAGRLREVPGIGPKTETKIVAALAAAPAASAPRLLLPQARTLSEQIATQLGGIVAGDPRRWADRPERLAIVVPTSHPSQMREAFAALPQIVALLDANTGVTLDGIPVELFVTPPENLGTTLVRATGSGGYVEPLEPLPAASDEETLFRELGLPFVPPELREAGFSGTPPTLVETSDIRGDLHVHTSWSDGRASVLQMGEAAKARGLDYLAICDHTPNVTVVPGLDRDALRRQAEEIAIANERLAPFRILRGVECDIRADGSLDLPDDILAELDWVQLSLHAGQRASRVELTKRVTEAMRHPAVRCLSHPMGRLIGHRPENALDLEQTIQTALETGVALEVNGLPNRLDLKAEYVKLAIAAGVQIVCSTDAHSTQGLENLQFAVHTARRGGATKEHVLNAAPLSGLPRRRERT